ncbi:MAG: glutaredoxin family protein [Dehalococcoidia bacterium]|nr:glutaredoxin family protein [Dehalococcoidia bacterium]
MHRVVLYGKDGCSLCSKTSEILKGLSAERPFLLEVVDITLEPASFDLYKEWIPVVIIDGVEVMRGIPNELRLRRSLGLDL